jgi:predicted AAA+ superfamily ATPase
LWDEYENHHGYLYAEQNLENRLLYGFYPDVLNHAGDEISILRNLVNSYLYKDILSAENYDGTQIPQNDYL